MVTRSSGSRRPKWRAHSLETLMLRTPRRRHLPRPGRRRSTGRPTTRTPRAPYPGIK